MLKMKTLNQPCILIIFDVYSNQIESEKNSIQQKLEENYNEEEFINKLKKMFKNQYFSMFKG